MDSSTKTESNVDPMFKLGSIASPLSATFREYPKKRRSKKEKIQKTFAVLTAVLTVIDQSEPSS